MSGFFNKPLEDYDDLTILPGDPKLVKEKKPGKEYNCNDCGLCSHAKKQIVDEENSVKEEKDETGKVTQKEKLAHKWIPIGGPKALSVQGKGKKKILIIADELTENGQEAGMSIIGQERKLLTYGLKQVGLDLEDDCYLVSSVRGWREDFDKKNMGAARKACHKMIVNDIKTLGVNVVVTLGFSALSTLIGNKISVTDKWDKFEGENIPDQDLMSWVLPTFSSRDFIFMLKNRQKQYRKWKTEKELKGEPSSYYDQALATDIPLVENKKLRTDEFIIKWRRFLRTLKEAKERSNQKVPTDDARDNVQILKHKKDILAAITFFMKQKNVTVDIEANSLKGYRKDAKILCIGISNYKRTVSYMTYDPEIIEATKKLIASEEVTKSCHNNPYEWTMFKNVWNVEMENVLYDSMLLVHGADHRTGVAGLKHQVYVKKGEKGFDGKTKPFFNKIADCDKGTKYDNKKNSQRLNGLEEALERGKLYEQGLLFPLPGSDKKIKEENKRRELLYKAGWLTEDEILLYVGSDAYYTAWLIKTIIPTLTKPELEAVKFFTEGALALSHMTQHGIYVNQKVLLKEMKEVTDRVDELQKQIMSCDEVKQWDGEAEFNPASNKQLTHLLFDILKYPVISRTATGAPQANKATLEKTGSPLCKMLLEQKALLKAKSTYMDGWYRAVDDNSRAHPEFLLFSTGSFRSSGSDPNAQNASKRDKKMKKLSRIFLEPTPGNILLEYDYSGAETFSAAAITGCPTMKNYMLDESTCMHSDTCCFLLSIDDKENLPSYTKDDGTVIEAPEGMFSSLRQVTKVFVFGQFYGDYYANQVHTLWEAYGQLPPDMKEWLELHMVAKGIASLNSFTDRLKAAQDDMWDRFKVYDQWKKDSWKEYVRQGYIDTVTGFRLTSVMDRKQISNLRVQGPSFHHLLHGIILCDREFRRLGLKSTFGAQVHDSFLVDLYPPEKEIVDKIITESFLIKAEQLPNLSWCKDLPFVMDRDEYELSWASKATATRLDRSVYTENYLPT